MLKHWLFFDWRGGGRRPAKFTIIPQFAYFCQEFFNKKIHKDYPKTLVKFAIVFSYNYGIIDNVNKISSF